MAITAIPIMPHKVGVSTVIRKFSDADWPSAESALTVV